MITPKLQSMIADSMKAGDSLRTEVLRMLSSAFNYEKIEKQHELTEEEEIAVIRKQAKQRKDSIEAYKKAGSEDRAQKEEDELKILQEFLPPEMDRTDLEKIVEEAVKSVGASSMADMGKVIGIVKSKAPTADGGTIAEIVKEKLNAS